MSALLLERTYRVANATAAKCAEVESSMTNKSTEGLQQLLVQSNHNNHPSAPSENPVNFWFMNYHLRNDEVCTFSGAEGHS